ncbi:MAG: DUF1667 domain-containing protein [Acetobacterium sp.]|nr:DUF1667 domain-containing protein [Bacillota bacterium]MCG2730554.1 DUF1667 domain-containing protein [Acetobacterium sp.]
MKELICILCPNGCALSVTDDQSVMIVTGQKCKRGQEFAIAETTNPTRTLCTTVKTSFPEMPVLPVQSATAIPKERIFDVMAAINQVVVTEALSCGTPVITDVLGLGIDMIATTSLENTNL